MLDFLPIIGDVVKRVIGAVLPAEKMSEADKAALDAKVQQEVNNLDLTIFEKEIDDRANARAREVSMAQAGQKDTTPPILAFIAVGGSIALTAMLFLIDLGKLSQLQVALIGSAAGVLGSNATTVYNYYFGSSSGSAKKSQTLDKVLGGNGGTK